MNNFHSVILTVLVLLMLPDGAAAQQTSSTPQAPVQVSPVAAPADRGLEAGLIMLVLIVLAGFCIYLSSLEPAVSLRTIVSPAVKYPNNHHVPGVGYYHAAHGRWFPLPWNEYREGQGYYHGGTWYPDPSLETEMTEPLAGQVDEVNLLWRSHNPDRMNQVWVNVERNGFGNTINEITRRSRGS